MCGRFSLATPAEAIAERFNLDATPPIQPRYNIAPSQPVAAIRANAKGEPEFALLLWGLIPRWSKDPNKGPRPINARAETIAEKPMFKGLLRYRRCAIVADGFYEWKKEGNRKRPYHIHLENHRPFAFAGLWELWNGPNGEELESCTIITTAANATMQQIHSRMPAILSPGNYTDWLDPQIQETAKPLQLLQADAGPLLLNEVSPLANNPRNDVPECINPV
ncbi:SOS response-associated peptidase [Synechococcus sp. PCC 7336]|uniref:SOS response-associated peptidase n=1 Tax=Synechococcus sp. PCC 7336 TaxID=195250 RepID=UPI00034B4F06|nr:SOS response-associated peptidase [Synechococcus sp. PCC 7336]